MRSQLWHIVFCIPIYYFDKRYYFDLYLFGAFLLPNPKQNRKILKRTDINHKYFTIKYILRAYCNQQIKIYCSLIYSKMSKKEKARIESQGRKERYKELLDQGGSIGKIWNNNGLF